MARIPVITSLAIDKFSGGVIQTTSSSTKNAVFSKYPDGRVFATQRPAVNVFEDASAAVSKAKGRGIYYWNKVSALYFVNEDTVYKNSHSSPLAATLTEGTSRIDFFAIGEYLVLIDSVNNEGWYINSGSSTTLNSITDVDFPSNQTPVLNLARGGAVLNGTLYVYATDGTIWNSAVEDPTSWSSLDFRTSELKPDPGVLMFRHSNHVVAVGTGTTEFFYDNTNPTGSPLSPRTDIDHSIGAIDSDTLWTDGDTAFFCNLNHAGDINVTIMSGFQVKKISNNDLDSLLTSAIVHDDIKVIGSGFSSGGRGFYALTMHIISDGVVTPYQSIVYDLSSNTWGEWELMQPDIVEFPLIGWTQATSTRAGNGILTNGDIITIVDNKIPYDTIEASAYVETGYVEAGYVATTPASGNNIELEIITGPADFGRRNYKRATNLKIVATPTENTQLMTVQTSDEGNDNYNTGRTIDLSKSGQKITRMGRFKTRNHKLTYSGDEQIEVEGIELDVT